MQMNTIRAGRTYQPRFGPVVIAAMTAAIAKDGTAARPNQIVSFLPPRYLRFDNGPEFVAGVVADWAKARHITLVFAEPGCPW